MARSGTALVVPLDACALLDDQYPRRPHMQSLRGSDLTTVSGAMRIAPSVVVTPNR
jgi:hypothetical protein